VGFLNSNKDEGGAGVLNLIVSMRVMNKVSAFVFA
jgi:hypothetical protein